MIVDRLMNVADAIMDRHIRKIAVVIVVLVVAITIAAGVVRANKGQSLISYEQINVGNEIQITAEDAITGMGEFRWDKLSVDSGQKIVIESELGEDGIEVCVTRGFNELYDETVAGAQTIEIEAEAGTYKVGTLPQNGATGTMSISVR